MPLGKGVKYRTIHRGGKLIRLAFKGNKVVEVKEVGEAVREAKKRRPKVR